MHRDLQAGVEQLRRADRLSAVGQLAASLAHEIRNPLASIQGAVSILDQSGAADETCRELRAIIRKECGRLQRLLTGMLDFARPHPVEYGRVDVTQKSRRSHQSGCPRGSQEPHHTAQGCSA